MQVDIVGPLLLNASLLLVLMTDYSDSLVQVTELIDNDIDNDRILVFWRNVWLTIHSFIVEKRLISEYLCLHSFLCVNFLIMIDSLMRQRVS